MGQHRKFQTFALLEEATPGTTPASAMQFLNLGGAPTFDRARTVAAPEFVTTGDLEMYPIEKLLEEGALSFPATSLQYRNWVQVHEGVYGNDETTVAAISETDISVTSDVMSNVGASAFTNLAVGDSFHIAFGGSGPTDGIYGPLLAAAAGSITFPAGQIADFAAGNTVVVKTFNRLPLAETFKSFSAEQVLTKLTTYFEGGTYYVPNSVAWSWAAGGSFATEEASFRGKKMTKATATIGTGAATAAPTAPAMNASGRVGTLWLGEVATNSIAGATIADWNYSLTRNNGFQPGVGSDDFDTACLGAAERVLTATMVLDDTTAALVDEFEDLDTLWARWDVVDAAGNRIVWFDAAMKPGERTKGEANDIINHTFTLTGHDPLKSSGDTHNITGMPSAAMFYIAA